VQKNNFFKLLRMKKPAKNKRKCGMYYYTYIPWAFKNNQSHRLDPEDIEWYNNVYLKERNEKK
tara:strand:- start:4106 stop:4294 length:189 start_codon:yes stop_codon:yes gene_type:complete